MEGALGGEFRELFAPALTEWPGLPRTLRRLGGARGVTGLAARLADDGAATVVLPVMDAAATIVLPREEETSIQLSQATSLGQLSGAIAPVKRSAGGEDLAPGDEVGQYRIVRRIGAGGFGAVYEAANVHNEDERVALKLLLAAAGESDTFAQLLKLEANALLRLKHPAVVQYRVFGRMADSDQFFLVTEYVPGPTLREWRRADVPTLDDVRTLAMRLAHGLAAAHRRGIVHRDLAPDNVIVMNNDIAEATLIDFGIAKLAEGDALANAFAGKFSYAAPEQLHDDASRVGAAADIYSFGLLIAAFVRGRTADMGQCIESARAARLAVPPLDDLPAPLQPILAQLLQPDPGARPADMDAVATLFDVMDWDGRARTAPLAVPTRRRLSMPAQLSLYGLLIATGGGTAIYLDHRAPAHDVTAQAPAPEAPPPAIPAPEPVLAEADAEDPDVRTASGAIEPAPAGTGPQPATGTVYGKAHADARIVYIARRDTDLRVAIGGQVELERILRQGDSYRLPNRPDVTISTGDAGALDVVLDGAFLGRAGPDDARLVDFHPSPDAYRMAGDDVPLPRGASL